MDELMAGPLPEIDPDRLSIVIRAFNIAFSGIPQSVDLVNRARLALDAAPDELVHELDEAVGVLTVLIRERLGI